MKLVQITVPNYKVRIRLYDVKEKFVKKDAHFLLDCGWSKLYDRDEYVYPPDSTSRTSQSVIDGQIVTSIYLSFAMKFKKKLSVKFVEAGISKNIERFCDSIFENHISKNEIIYDLETKISKRKIMTRVFDLLGKKSLIQISGGFHTEGYDEVTFKTPHSRITLVVGDDCTRIELRGKHKYKKKYDDWALVNFKKKYK